MKRIHRKRTTQTFIGSGRKVNTGRGNGACFGQVDRGRLLSYDGSRTLLKGKGVLVTKG